LVDHADAAAGDTPTDGPRFDRAVDAVECILVALPEVHGENRADCVGRPVHRRRFAMRSAAASARVGVQSSPGADTSPAIPACRGWSLPPTTQSLGVLHRHRIGARVHHLGLDKGSDFADR
jgi:hypothetical protein